MRGRRAILSILIILAVSFLAGAVWAETCPTTSNPHLMSDGETYECSCPSGTTCAVKINTDVFSSEPEVRVRLSPIGNCQSYYDGPITLDISYDTSDTGGSGTSSGACRATVSYKQYVGEKTVWAGLSGADSGNVVFQIYGTGLITCTDECTYYEKECYGSGYRSCGNYDEDYCLDWSSVTECPSGSECQAGECVTVCGDGMCGSGETCEDDNCCSGQSVDLDTDSNNCGSCGNTCPSGETCSSGQCVSSSLTTLTFGETWGSGTLYAVWPDWAWKSFMVTIPSDVSGTVVIDTAGSYNVNCTVTTHVSAFVVSTCVLLL